ncbi:hypothetical protein OROMI_004107 [Orobanche minor]
MRCLDKNGAINQLAPVRSNLGLERRVGRCRTSKKRQVKVRPSPQCLDLGEWQCRTSKKLEWESSRNHLTSIRSNLGGWSAGWSGVGHEVEEKALAAGLGPEEEAVPAVQEEGVENVKLTAQTIAIENLEWPIRKILTHSDTTKYLVPFNQINQPFLQDLIPIGNLASLCNLLQSKVGAPNEQYAMGIAKPKKGSIVTRFAWEATTHVPVAAIPIAAGFRVGECAIRMDIDQCFKRREEARLKAPPRGEAPGKRPEEMGIKGKAYKAANTGWGAEEDRGLRHKEVRDRGVVKKQPEQRDYATRHEKDVHDGSSTYKRSMSTYTEPNSKVERDRRSRKYEYESYHREDKYRHKRGKDERDR